jgi:hypothetical protein
LGFDGDGTIRLGVSAPNQPGRCPVIALRGSAHDIRSTSRAATRSAVVTR